MEKRMSQGREKKVKQKAKTSILLTVLICGLIGALGFHLISLRSEINAAKEQLASAQGQYDRISASNEELKLLLSGDDYIERIARDKYGFILPGEEVYEDISGN